jgi:hypothetical protein
MLRRGGRGCRIKGSGHSIFVAVLATELDEGRAMRVVHGLFRKHRDGHASAPMLGLSVTLVVAILTLASESAAVEMAPARTAHARSGFIRSTFPTLDLIALRSDQIGTILVLSSEDSMSTPRASMGIQKLGYRVLTNIRGQLPAPPLRLFVIKVGPGIEVGDTLLWLREMTPDSTSSQEDTAHYNRVFDLSDMRRTTFGNYALRRDFRVLTDPNALVTTIARRIAMIEVARPLGDDRRYSVVDFGHGRAAIVDEMRPGSEADLATDGLHCCNQLAYPADRDLLPGLLEQTRDPDPWTRAFAAEALAEYPGRQARGRLSKLLSDTAARLEACGYQGADSVRALLAVQAAAIESLRRMRALEQVQGH